MRAYFKEPRRIRTQLRLRACTGALLLISCLAAGGCASTPAEPRAEEVARAHAHLSLSRIGVIGASASAGFGTGVPLAIPLSASIRVPHQMVDGARSMFFLNPDKTAREELDLMRQEKVSVVVAVDFLFWFAYGGKPEAFRSIHLERGMQMLQEIEAEIFVGDLPDMRGASELMLPVIAVPSAEELASMNRAIADWAARNPHVRILPLAKWAAAARAARTRGAVAGAAKSTDATLLQWDRLHPSRSGLVELTILCAEAIRGRFPALAAADTVLERDRLAAILPEPGQLPPAVFRGPLPLDHPLEVTEESTAATR